MYIILSQRIDIQSSYLDNPFKSYHYPSRYRNQIHTGDTFIYYQGDRYHKEHRYYFGTGKIGKIEYFEDNDTYTAELLYCKKFTNKVSIYINDGYCEQYGYQTVRNKPAPSWQNSIRKLSVEAYNYIIKSAGKLMPMETQNIDDLKSNLKSSIQKFYIHGQNEEILNIVETANQIAYILKIKK